VRRTSKGGVLSTVAVSAGRQISWFNTCKNALAYMRVGPDLMSGAEYCQFADKQPFHLRCQK